MYRFILGILLSNCFIILVLGLFVFLKNRRNPINRTFVLWQVALFLWLFTFFIWTVISKAGGSISLVLFWARFSFAASMFIPVFYYHWILNLVGKVRENKKILIIGYLVLIFALLFSYSPLTIVELKKVLDFWPAGPQGGPFYNITLLNYSFLLTFSYYQLFINYKKSTGYRRSQIRYVALGAGVAFFTNGPIIFSLAFGIQIPAFLYAAAFFFVSIYTFIYTYAIVKYRLMDIRLIIKRTVIFSILALVTTTFYVLTAFLFGSLIFGRHIEADGLRPMVYTGLLVGFIVALGARPLYELLERSTDRFFFKGEYRPQELIKNISEKLSSSLETIKIKNTLLKEITGAMKLEGASFFDIEASVKGLPIKNLINYFNKQKEILVVQEMELEYRDGLVSDGRKFAYEDLKKTSASVVIPIYEKSEPKDHEIDKGRLTNILALKDKKSGDAFNGSDIQTLQIISSQASISLDNARMYEEIKRLLEAKSQFITIVSHQIKNPTAIIKGLASLLTSGIYKKKTQIEGAAQKIKETSDRLFSIVNNILDTQRIEAGTLQYEFKKINLNKIIEEAIGKIEVLAEEKGLKIIFEPEKAEIFIMGDEIKIYQCILNLIDNAIKFTNVGFINVKLFSKDGYVIFEVSDSGRGIPKELLPKLFSKFERGGEEILAGFGLGLYITKIFIDAHKGEIWAESDGEGKGSKFFIKLKLVE